MALTPSSKHWFSRSALSIAYLTIRIFAIRRGLLATTLLLSILLCGGAGWAQPSPAAGAAAAPFSAQLTIRADRAGAKIDRNIYGSFAEHLGRGIYEGIWVGEGSPIPNTRGIRNDVIAALRNLKLPVLRWPGGCFADEYHWREVQGDRIQLSLPSKSVSVLTLD